MFAVYYVKDVCGLYQLITPPLRGSRRSRAGRRRLMRRGADAEPKGTADAEGSRRRAEGDAQPSRQATADAVGGRSAHALPGRIYQTMTSSIQWNPALSALPVSGIRRMFNLAATMEDVIHLSIGQPDFPHAPAHHRGPRGGPAPGQDSLHPGCRSAGAAFGPGPDTTGNSAAADWWRRTCWRPPEPGRPSSWR